MDNMETAESKIERAMEKGEPINMVDIAEALGLCGIKLRRDELANGVLISTIRLRPVHRSMHNYETVVFGGGDGCEEIDRGDYMTEEEALRGHQKLLDKWSGGGTKGRANANI